MKIELRADTELVLTELAIDGFEIAGTGEELHFGSMQMFVTALGMCTFSVLASYGQRFGTAADNMSIILRWAYAERPYRIGEIDMQIHWPELPASRLDAATRAAYHCTLHNTLSHGSEVTTLVEN